MRIIEQRDVTAHELLKIVAHYGSSGELVPDLLPEAGISYRIAGSILGEDVDEVVFRWDPEEEAGQ